MKPLKRCAFEGTVHAVKYYTLITSSGVTFCERDFHCLPWKTFAKDPNATKKRSNTRVTCLVCVAEEV